MKKQEEKYLCVMVDSEFGKTKFIEALLKKFPTDNIISILENATVSKYCKENNITYAVAKGASTLQGFISFSLLFTEKANVRIPAEIASLDAPVLILGV